MSPAILGLFVLGLALLVAGAELLVRGAARLAARFGVLLLAIGLTVVAFGTSTPELAVSAQAGLAGRAELALGNVVGSSLLNLPAIVGISALVAPGGLEVAPALLRFDIPVMIAVALACLRIFATGHRIARWEGALFLGYYAAFVLYLFLDATQHDAPLALRAAMLGFVLPLTAATLIVLLVRYRTLAAQDKP